MTSYLDTINSVGGELRLNNASNNAVVIGYGLTSQAQQNTFGASTIGAITGSSATFSSTVTTTGMLTAGSGGFTSTAGTTSLGSTTINSATVTTSLDVSGLLTAGNGLTSTAGTTTLGASTIGAITGSSASFTTVSTSQLLTANNGLTVATGATSLQGTTVNTTLNVTGTSTLGTTNITGLVTFSGGIATSGNNSMSFGDLSVTTLSSSGVITSTLAQGTAPFSITSNTVVPNLNASLLNGKTFADPGIIGNTTASSATFTTITANTTVNAATIAMTGNISMGNNKITGLGAPTDNTDAVTKLYVDNLIQGLDIKQSVKVATTASLTLADVILNYSIDGVSLAIGDRVLIKNQGSTANGIYTVNETLPPTRATDFQTGAGVAGAFVFVERGTVNSDTGWVCTNNTGSDIAGTDTLVFTQFSGAGGVDVGAGLVRSGNTISVNSTQNLSNLTLTGATNGSVGISAQSTGTAYAIQLPNTTPANRNSLVSNGSGLLAWETLSTINSVTLEVPSFLSVSGSPLTTTGTITIGLSGTALQVANGGTGATSFTQYGVLLGNGSSAITNDTDFYYQTDILYTPSISITNTGANSLVIAGGTVINLATDATSEVAGGTITTAGGFAAAKSAFIGTNLTVGTATAATGIISSKILELRGSTSGAVSIKPQAVAGTYDFNLPTSLGASGQMLVSGGVGNPMSWATPSANSAPQTYTTAGMDNQSAPTNVSGLIFDYLVSTQFNIQMKVDRGPVSQIFEMTGIYQSGSWSMTTTSIVGGSTGVVFSIQSSGQVQYTSTSTGVVITFSWSRYSTTQGTNYLALTGASSNTVTIVPPSIAFTNYNFNLPSSAGTSGQILSSGGGAGEMNWVSLTQGSAAPETYTSTGVQNGNGVVPNLSYTAGTFDINMTVDVTATTSLRQLFKLRGSLSPSSGWSITVVSITGDDTLVDFGISSTTINKTFTIASVSTGTTCTVTTTTNHTYSIGETITISGATGVTGGPLNGTFTVLSTPTPTTYTITVVSSITAYTASSASGTLTTPIINGQVTYTSGAYAGFVELRFTWARYSITQGTNYLVLSGLTSGTISVAPQEVAGTYNFNLPTTAGNAGEMLVSGGGGAAAMYWSSSPMITSLNLSSLTASRAVATDASKNLVSVATTGTGNYVLAESPTLTGTLSCSAISASGLITANAGLTVANDQTLNVGTSGSTSPLNVWGLITGSNGLTVSNANTSVTTLSASGQITSTVSTGTPPFVVASTTNVVNLNASSLNGATFASPGTIGGTTAGSGAFTTLSASGLISANLGLTSTTTTSTNTSILVNTLTTNSIPLTIFQSNLALGNNTQIQLGIDGTTANLGGFIRFTRSSTSITITNIQTGTTTPTVTTSGAHGLLSGNSITITGNTSAPTSLNGIYTVTVVTSTTFTITSVSVTTLNTPGSFTSPSFNTIQMALTAQTNGILFDGNNNVTIGTSSRGTLSIPNSTGTSLIVSSNQASTSTTTGALVVTGGVGIGDDLSYGGTLINTNNPIVTLLSNGISGSFTIRSQTDNSFFRFYSALDPLIQTTYPDGRNFVGWLISKNYNAYLRGVTVTGLNINMRINSFAGSFGSGSSGGNGTFNVSQLNATPASPSATCNSWSVLGNILTLTNVNSGLFTVGMVLSGTGIATNTTITAINYQATSTLWTATTTTAITLTTVTPGFFFYVGMTLSGTNITGSPTIATMTGNGSSGTTITITGGTATVGAGYTTTLTGDGITSYSGASGSIAQLNISQTTANNQTTTISGRASTAICTSWTVSTLTTITLTTVTSGFFYVGMSLTGLGLSTSAVTTISSITSGSGSSGTVIVVSTNQTNGSYTTRLLGASSIVCSNSFGGEVDVVIYPIEHITTGDSILNDGSLTINSRLASTSTTTGALTVAGGVGIGGATFIGGTLGVVGNITSAGDVFVFGTVSDRRLKTNVTPIENGIDTVKLLKPITFNWKDDIFNLERRGQFDSGFIAQEIMEILPHASGEFTEPASKEVYKNIRHERIIPYLVKSIQELSEKIEAQQKIIDKFLI